MLALLNGCDDETSNDDNLGNWVRSSDYEGDRRANAVVFTIGEYAYVGTGYNGSTGDYFTDFYSYNYRQRYWTEIDPLPAQGRTDGVSFVVGSVGYVGLGYDGRNYLNDFYRFDLGTQKWDTIASFPGDGRRAAVAFSVGGYGFVGTGYNGSRDFQDFWQYKPETDEWVQIPSLNGRRREAVSFVIDDLVYLGTGTDNGNYLTDFLRFDYKLLPNYPWTSLNSLTEDDDYTISRSGGVAFTINGLGYVATGYSGAMDRTVWEYNPDADSWTQKNDIEASVASRRDAVAFVIEGSAFVATGSSGSSFFYDMWIFDPTSEEDEED